MKWVAIAGSWRESAPTIETDVRVVVKEILKRGDGVVTGGALGVDYFATDEYLKLDPTAARLRIFLPCTLERYVAHYRERSGEGIITREKAESLIAQLERVSKANPQAIMEGVLEGELTKEAYFNRITSIIEAADELYAFQINMSEGTQDTIDKAKKRGIPFKIHTYTV